MSTMTSEMTLIVKDDILEPTGFSQLTINLILREKLNSVLNYTRGDAVIFPSVYSEFTPLGNPPKFMAGYAFDKDNAYLSVFRTQDTAIHLSAQAPRSQIKHNPIFVLTAIKAELENSLVQSKSDLENLALHFEKQEKSVNLDLIRSLENFDSILYSLLARKKIVIIGPTEEAVTLLESIYNIIPAKFRLDFGFSVNIPYVENQAVVISVLDPELDQDIKDKTAEFLENEVDIINLQEKMCYGQFTCEYTKRLWTIIQNEDDLSAAYEIVEEIVSLEEVVNDNETAQQFGDRLSIKYDNADLIVMIRQNTKLIYGGS